MFAHLNKHKITYCEHCAMSCAYAVYTHLASWVFAVHAICPDCCEQTGSELVASLHHHFKTREESRGQTVVDQELAQKPQRQPDPF